MITLLLEKLRRFLLGLDRERSSFLLPSLARRGFTALLSHTLCILSNKRLLANKRLPGPPLFLDQTEARRVEKICFFGPGAPLILGSGWPPPPYPKVWIRHCSQCMLGGSPFGMHAKKHARSGGALPRGGVDVIRPRTCLYNPLHNHLGGNFALLSVPRSWLLQLFSCLRNICCVMEM